MIKAPTPFNIQVKTLELGTVFCVIFACEISGNDKLKRKYTITYVNWNN